MSVQTVNEIHAALQLLKSKEWVDLTHSFGPDSPHFFMFDDAKFETLFTHDDGFFAQKFFIPWTIWHTYRRSYPFRPRHQVFG